MREAIHNLEASKIREVANAGMGRDDVLAFWFGESDEVTPEVVRQAAIESLQRGETFYAHNLGLPELREAIARYTSALHPAVDASRIAVTSGGVSALMLAVQALVDAGDEVVAVTPVWPNLTAQPAIMGAHVRTLPLVPVNGQWTLDLPALRAAVTSKTKLLIVNAPNNPTGWTMSRDEQQAMLDHCRQTGTWILADEVYERLYFEPTHNACAPSFLDISKPDDRLVVTHSFSKSFLMTGWRLGWLVAPPRAVPALEKLAQNLYISAPSMAQHAALACFTPEATAIFEQRRGEFQARRDYLLPALRALGFRIAVEPQGAFYLYADISEFGIDAQAFCRHFLETEHVAFTPGIDFGTHQAERHVRIAYTQALPRLQEAVARIERGLGRL